MKKLFLETMILPSVATIILISCGQQGGHPSLEQKIAERDSCLRVIDELNEKVKQLNLEISESDTSISSNKRKIYVNTMTLKRDTFVHYLQVQGIVEANKNILVSPEAMGIVKQIQVEEGQEVIKGQTLMVLDNEIINKNIAELETQLDLADELFKRQENLWNQKIGSEVQYLESKARMEGLEKSLLTMQTQLSKMIINSPENGIVDEIFLNTGEMANPMAPVIRIVNLDNVCIKSDVSENYINKVWKNQKVKVFFPSLNEEFSVVISATGNYINPGNRTFKIRADLKNKDGILKPNLLGIIHIKDIDIPNSISVPGDYILSSSEGVQYVYILENNNDLVFAKKVIVKTGISYDGNTLIEDGLDGNELLITEGARMVTNGESVLIKQSY